MAKRKSEGTCSLCGMQFGKGSMSRHLESCRTKARQSTAAPEEKRTFTAHRRRRFAPVIGCTWKASADATLDDLDALLRHTWLECCGHCSDFQIGETRYSHASEMGWKRIRR